MDQITQDLQAAYDYLEEHGWCQHSFEADDGKVCLAGAVLRATGYHRDFWGDDTSAARYKNKERYENATSQIYKVLQTGIFGWNDASERTVEDVKLILKKAINDV